jgi:high-affinity iron transporter
MTAGRTTPPQASRRSLRVWRSCVATALALSLAAAGSAHASAPIAPAKPVRAVAIAPTEAQTLDMLLALLPGRYESAHPLHDTKLAAPVRLLARAMQERVLQARPALAASDPTAAARALTALDGLTKALRATDERYQPWPLGFEVDDLARRARVELASVLHPPAWPAEPYRQIEPALDRVLHRARTADPTGDAVDPDVLRVYALYAAGPGKRLLTQDAGLDAQITRELLLGDAGAPALNELLAEGASSARLEHATGLVRANVDVAAQVLGLVKVSQATIVTNGAIIVFREGLEAILILAAITASFVGARRRLRRPVLIGALAGVLVTVLTWIVAQVLLHALGDGGLKLQAVTGLVAIAVLLLITNWFFHRVYWSEWISRFNRRRKAIERFDRVGFLSGQVIGLVLLGVSSVYREGLETVLFLQALQTSAGLGAAALGAGIGLGATLIVGVITFKVQRKLPFKRMLILTGVLIALVLAVMVGTTVHNMQGVGWLPTTTTSFDVSINWSMWLGVYPTWEGIGAQLGALVFVLGSYFAARELQVRGPRRRSLRASAAPTSRVGAADA